MAKQVINIGTTANDGTGDPLRSAFDKVNDNFTELYTDDAGDVNSIIGGTSISVDQATGNVTVTNDAPNATHTGDVTGSGVLTIGNDKVITAKILDANVTTAKIADANITVAKMAANSVDSDQYVDGSIDADHIAANAVITAKILNDNITHDKLEARYMAQVAISTLTGTVAFDCLAGSSFKLSGDLTGAYTINLSNYKKGQVISIFPLKAQSITLAGQGSSSNTFNKIGGDYDNSTHNILQIECVDDSATAPIFFYSIATFAADSTP